MLNVDVEEKSTGELQLSAGYSSLERFIIAANVAQRNFMGKGQELNAGVNWSRYSRSVNLGFTEPQLFDKNVLLGADIFRRDYNSWVASETMEDYALRFTPQRFRQWSEWRVANTISIKETAEQLGVELRFLDAQQKQDSQILAVRKLIVQKVDIIGIAPIVETGWEEVQ